MVIRILATAILVFSTLATFYLSDRFFGQLFAVSRPKPESELVRVARLRKFPANIDTLITPSEDDLRRSDNLAKNSRIVRTDNYGFLLPHNEISGADISAVFLGGSTTECRYLHEEKRFPRLVEKLISNRNPENKFVVLNGGFSGNNYQHFSSILVNEVLALKPDYIFFMENINDLMILLYTGSYWNESKLRSPVAIMRDGSYRYGRTLNDIALDFATWLIPNTKYQFTNYLLQFRSGNGDEWAMLRGKKHKIDVRLFLHEFERMVRVNVAIVQAAGTTPVIMTQFNRFKDRSSLPVQIMANELKIDSDIDFDDFVSVYDSFNEQLRIIGSEPGRHLIDLAAAIPATREYIYDTVHLTEEGAKLAAEEIDRFILKIGVPEFNEN